MFAAVVTAKAGGFVERMSLERSLTGSLGEGGYTLLGAGIFLAMGVMLYVIGTRKVAAT